MQHVVHVTNSLGVNGGAEQQLVSNLQRFRDRRLRHTLLALYPDDEGTLRTGDVPDSVGLEFVFESGERPRSRFDLVRRVDARLGALDPDLVHCSVADASLASRLAGRRRRIPVIETLVNISHEPVRAVDNPNVTRGKLAAHRLLDKVTMRSVARFHALTPAVSESWQQTVGLPTEKMVVIPRGVDPARVVSSTSRVEARARLFAELAIDGDPQVVLNVGRQTSQKGQRYLIEAVSRIRSHVPESVFVIAGQSGTNSEELAGLAAQQSGVFLLGARDDVPELMAAADVFAFPSLFEGLGVSLLEAMANGLAVVTTDAPPMSGIVEHRVNGLLVPARDSAAIAGAVVELAGDAELAARLGRAARDHVEAEYPLDRAAASIERLYLTVLDGHERSA